MELFLERTHVATFAKLRVALSYLDGEATRWYALSLGPAERPRDWKGLKAFLLAHYADCDVGPAVERLRESTANGGCRSLIGEAERCSGRLCVYNNGANLRLRPEMRCFVYL